MYALPCYCRDLAMNGSHIRVKMRTLKDRGVMVYIGRESYLTTAENGRRGRPKLIQQMG